MRASPGELDRRRLAPEDLRRVPKHAASEALIAATMARLEVARLDDPTRALNRLPRVAPPATLIPRIVWRLRFQTAAGRRRRRALPPALAWVSAGLAALFIFGWIWLRRGENRAPAPDRFHELSRDVASPVPVPVPTPAPRDVLPARVVALAGDAALWRARERLPLTPGQILRRGDELRTDREGKAALKIGSDCEVRLDTSTHVRWAADSATVPVLELREGRLEGRIEPTSPRPAGALELSAAGHLVRLLGGAVGVLRAPDARLALASLGGPALVIVGGQRVMVPPRHQLRLWRPGAVALPEPLPSRLHLKLARVISDGGRNIHVHGQTDPHLLLVINGGPVRTTRRGRFRATVSARGGLVVATVRDASGRARELQRNALPLDTRYRWPAPG